MTLDLDWIVREAGLDGISGESTAPDVITFFERLSPSLASASPLERELARRIVETQLTERGIPDARRLVAQGFASFDGTGKESASGRSDDKLQGQALPMRDPEPWPEPVDGADLLVELVCTFARFAALQEGAATTLALWTVHAHALETAQVSPILAINSPEKECGKTTLLTLLLALTPRALLASNISTAGVFRVVERYRPTLLVDEADTFLPANEELRGVLNSGHFRAGAHVVRNVGDDFEPRTFSTWCAKAIALIGDLPDTLTSRSLPLRMRRCTAAEAAQLASLRLDRLHELEALRRRTYRWAQDQRDALKRADPAVPDGLRGRSADNWRPLLAIADAAGGVWPERARRAAALLSGASEGEDQAPGVQLLADIRELFRERGTTRLASADIVEALVVREDRPWPEWRKGKPLTATQLARLLRRFGIRPKHLREGMADFRGYPRASFSDAFARYLPGEVSQPGGEVSHLSHGNPPPELFVTGVTGQEGGIEETPIPGRGDAWEPDPEPGDGGDP